MDEEDISQQINKIIDFLESPGYIPSDFHFDSPRMSPDQIAADLLSKDQQNISTHNAPPATFPSDGQGTSNVFQSNPEAAASQDVIVNNDISLAHLANNDTEFRDLVHTRLEQIRDEQNEPVSDEVIEQLTLDILDLYSQGIYQPFDNLLL